MKRTTMFMSLALIALVIPGCSTASAQCPGGRCYTASVWSPWAGFYYSNSPCAGGRCRTVKKPDPKVEETKEPEPPVVAELSICGKVAQIINARREALGLPVFEVDPELCISCDRHSAFMASGGGFQHGYYTGARECIAYGVRSPEAVVNLWLNSSGHRAIILGGGKTLGVGCSGNYWTLRVR
ncbi:MAG: CAP domain-containing protein [Thermoguttaceae bacterium]|nr:CAP domain-containing protein [Thermoguttaceae bacterium]